MVSRDPTLLVGHISLSVFAEILITYTMFENYPKKSHFWKWKIIIVSTGIRTHTLFEQFSNIVTGRSRVQIPTGAIIYNLFLRSV